jgi:hypothetical protein
VVEPHQSGGAFGRDAEPGREAGGQALAAPTGLARQMVDPHPPPGGARPPPGVGDLRGDRRAAGQPSTEDLHRDREPLVPRRGDTQPVLGSPGVATPDIRQRHHRPAEFGRRAEHRGRRDRLQPDLRALAHPAGRP